MKHIYYIVLMTAILAVFCNCKNASKEVLPAEENENWISLFNGKNLDDWIIKIKGFEINDNAYNTFRAEDGVMKVSYKAYDTFNNNFGHIFYKTPFSSYRLNVDYRFTGKQMDGGPTWAKRNSGVMVHSQSPESMGLHQAFPLSIEVQMLGGLEKGQSRPTGNLCTPGTHVVMDDKLITEHCINSTGNTYYDDTWVNMEVMVIKDSIITHSINGKEVMRYYKPQIGGSDMSDYNGDWASRIGKSISQGYISLQSESHPIEFKNIKLLKLE